MNGCKICARDDLELVEQVGQQALAEDISWRAAAKDLGLVAESFKNHMLKHVVLPEVKELQAQAEDEMDRLIAEAREGLLEQFALSPPDVKPLILVAMQNLEGLKKLKPSQEALIRALKTVQEMTGMKQEQRLMLDVAAAMNRRQALKVSSTSKPVLEVVASESA